MGVNSKCSKKMKTSVPFLRLKIPLGFLGQRKFLGTIPNDKNAVKILESLEEKLYFFIQNRTVLLILITEYGKYFLRCSKLVR